MDKIGRYLEVVPLPLLLVAMVGVFAVFVVIPAKYRMPMALSLTMIWLPVGEMPGLGLIQAIAKVTGFAVYGLVAVTAWLDITPPRRTPPMAWLSLVTSAFAFVFILAVSALLLALALLGQCMIVFASVLSVVRMLASQVLPWGRARLGVRADRAGVRRRWPGCTSWQPRAGSSLAGQLVTFSWRWRFVCNG